ncbi:hypothetical protein BH23PSE2_BH23PSE2_09510 [soil metagenome]
MRGRYLLLALVALPGFAHAVDCATIAASQGQPVRATVLAPVATELAAPSYQLGAHSGVLAHAYDESQSLDQVLLRLRIEGCRTVARATPAPASVPTLIDPKDPSVYQPKTEFDNTPWRFDMNQNGKRMTADEFDAWMSARGIRIVGGKAVVGGSTQQPIPQPTPSEEPAP